METTTIDILLVEDNESDAELTLRVLKKNHVANKFHLVKDGEEALDFLFATGKFSGRDISLLPKLVILDINLPKVDGLEVLRRIKSDERTKSVPVVVLTSSKEQSDVIAGYKLGANSFIVKPVDFQKFMYTVNELGLYWLKINEPPA